MDFPLRFPNNIFPDSTQTTSKFRTLSNDDATSGTVVNGQTHANQSAQVDSLESTVATPAKTDAPELDLVKSESFTLTKTARNLVSTQENAKETPFDSARVEQIKKEIATGNFTINYQRLASRMITSENFLN